MRLPPPRRTFSTCLALVLLSFPVFAAQYSSTSPQELQRRLEQDTNRLVDSLRSQRNSPSRSSSSGVDPWTQQIRERQAREREQDRLDADWRRDHPNETRQQYFSRIEREALEEARAERREREEAIRAQRAREAAERERQEAADWARIRASYGGYAAQVRPPLFATPAESLDWYLRHESSTNNEWAGNQAAMLLIEGVGVFPDIPKAVRLLDPNSPTAKKTGSRHPETRALFAYLQLTYPDAVKSAGLEVNAAAARTDLEAAAAKSPLAQWYLARVLNESAVPADQKRALRLITPGAIWARANFAGRVRTGPSGRDPLFKHLGALSVGIVEKQRAHLPALLRELPMPEFEIFEDLLSYTAEPLRTEAMNLYVEGIAERVVPLTPVVNFNYYAFDNILGKAGEAHLEAVYGLAALRRAHLLGIEDRDLFKPSWGHVRDTDRTLAALTRWSARDDLLGARARLALASLAVEANSPLWWTPSLLPEVAAYQKAAAEHTRLLGTTAVPAGSTLSIFHLRDAAEAAKNTTRKAALEASARRDASAPKPNEVPGLLASMKIGAQWREELQVLKNSAAGKGTDASAVAVTHASFDLTRAAALYDAAFAPDIPEALRWHTLFEAMSLGDAFAPGVLARELSSDLPPPVREKLLQLRAARWLRDEAARNPRALVVRLIQKRYQGTDDLEPLLAEAVATGSPLAVRIQLALRIAETMSNEGGQPVSYQLEPAQIAEFDTAIAALNASPNPLAERSLLHAILEEKELGALDIWFDSLNRWEADRQERLGDAAFIKAVQPEIDAVLATLAEWPGINQGDPLSKTWAIAATNDREAALKSLEAKDGLAALKLFLSAAGRGDRGAVSLLARHVRTGTGGLPRSAELADSLQAAALKMTMTDADVGDAFAANYLGECFREGENGVVADPVQALAWLRYAADLGQATAARTLAQADAGGLNRTPADLVHWAAVRDACEYNEFLPKPPRRIVGPRLDLAAIRPQLEAALTALKGFRTKKPVELTSEQEDAAMARTNAAKNEFKKDPAKGLVLLAQIAAGGNRYVAQDIARILARGDGGVQPDAALAQRFHAAGMSLLERDAEYGDFSSAARLATYAIGLGEKPDVPGAIRWLTYSAELGSYDAAETLAKLYTDGAPGLPADPAIAARWTAFAEKTNSDDFKPRAPLRE